MLRWDVKNKIIIVFLAAFVIRMLALASFEGEQSLIFSDSKHYLQIAQNLIEHGVYSVETSPTPKADNLRTPIFPLLLMPFLYFNFSLYWISLLNDILMALAAVATFSLGRRLFNEKIAFLAALFSGLEPYSALISNQILTEATFTLTLTLSLLLMAIYIAEKKTNYLYIGSLMLAISALTKPMALALFILIPAAIFLRKIGEAHPDNRVAQPIWKEIILSFLIFMATISPWIIFNRLTLNIWSFSTFINHNLYESNSRAFNQWLLNHNKIPAADALISIDHEKYWDPEIARQYFETAKNFIIQRPLEYAEFTLFYAHRLFWHSGYETIIHGINPKYETGQAVPFKNDIWKLNLAGAISKLKAMPGIAFIVGGELFFLAISLLALLNLFIRFQNKTYNSYCLFFFITIMLYALLVSPIGVARYRIPINPILFLLALDSLMVITPLARGKFIKS